MSDAKTRSRRTTYDPEANALYITIRDEKVAHTKQLAHDVIVDYDKDGEIVGIEILDIAEKLDT